MNIGTSHPSFDAVKHLLSPKPLRCPKRTRLERCETAMPAEVVERLKALRSAADWNRRDDLGFTVTTSA